ncbi:hypothetical protein [Microbacterium sp. PM5]|uniref:phage portal protein family protein n=1 Tax=Microbacterium sp. PM5 TaxID=2014534 RepID=UPI000DD16942|nr:hypothetical protein [Microbacterium sp. PM5]AXA95453.1 hypothetical protein CEP17_02915 [Microbacterium sp. PM5]
MPEIGYQADPGLVGWASLLSWMTERNPDLQWPQSVEVFDRMRREDPQVKSVLRAVTLPILRTDWVIDGSGCREEVTNHIADDLGLPVKGQPFVAPLRTKGRFSFKEFLRLASLELVYGHSFFEQVYEIDANGLAHIGKLAWRPPRTISEIDVASDGGLVAIKQQALKDGKAVVIPVDRLVAFVNEREGANWFGESLLRAAYKMFILKDRVLRIQALTAERNGLGLPVYKAPPLPENAVDWTFDQATKWLDDQIEAGKKLATEARAGDAAGVGLPNGADFSFMGVTGKLPDTDALIRYYDEQIAAGALLHFLSLGGDNATGSYALGETFATFFTDSLNAVAQHLAEVIQQHVIEDLVDANWGPSEPAPRIIPAVIGETQPITADALKALVDAKVIFPDAALEAWTRAKYGMPVKDPATSTAQPTQGAAA